MGDKSTERWAAITQATTAAPPWLAFRYLYAQAHNRHAPNPGVQAQTKKAAEAVAVNLVAALGGDLRALPPPGLDKDENWTAFLKATAGLEPGEQRSMMWHIVRQQWGDPGTRSEVWLEHMETMDTLRHEGHRTQQHDRMDTLSVLLLDMHLQGRANRRKRKRNRRGGKRKRKR